MKLPIDIIPGTMPFKFVWTQVIADMDGGSLLLEHAGAIPASLEGAVTELIRMCKRLQQENAELRKPPPLTVASTGRRKG